MRKIERDYALICSSAGFDVLWIEQRHGHYALIFEAGKVFCAGTPSDRRNRANVLSAIRRLHR